MNTLWSLPVSIELNGHSYPIHGDYRDILEIFSYFNDPALPEPVKWRIALALFYAEPVPSADIPRAMEAMVSFMNGGKEEKSRPGGKLLDWEQDSAMIVADINKAAGQEIRALPFLHWWSFLSWFHAIGEGQLSTVVAIRDKLAKGKKLEEWEKRFYRENRETVDLKKRYTQQEQYQRQRLEQLLEQKGSEETC